ncbi:MAG: hypothetical protein HC841_02850 [Verrucomicrobiae bacterium]|nr:hypothetical protein [Verrucomicrobiae bacterium]
MWKQFQNIQKYLRNKYLSGEFALIEELVDAARNKLTFVFILLKDPGLATTVFEGLNDPGVPIAIGDLVKNEVFARREYNESEAQAIHDQQWIPFREKFGDSFNNFFFPYCVIMRPNASQTDMFSALRATWKELDAQSIIKKIDIYSNSFLALNGNAEALDSYQKGVSSALRRLVALKQPSSALTFEMRLLKALEDQEIGGDEVVGALEVIESFLVRRAICGIEPTGLLGMFRTMWSATDGHPNAERVAAVISKRLTGEGGFPSQAQRRADQANRMRMSLPRPLKKAWIGVR